MTAPRICIYGSLKSRGRECLNCQKELGVSDEAKGTGKLQQPPDRFKRCLKILWGGVEQRTGGSNPNPLTMQTLVRERSGSTTKTLVEIWGLYPPEAETLSLSASCKHPV